MGISLLPILVFLEGDNDTISAHLAEWSSPNDLRGAFSSEMIKPNMISGFRKNKDMQQIQMERLNT